ncbi:MAG: hypothetical protein NT023_23960 [Armatimonadetes bacterium]|nr:hypothetical protein [Armatimonadota bacterium]
MASYRTGDFVGALKKKGLDHVEERGHHTYYVLYHKGVKQDIQTYVSRGERDFSDKLINERRKQLCLTSNAQFRDFVNCPLTKEQYIALLIQNGDLDSDAGELMVTLWLEDQRSETTHGKRAD